MEAVGSGGAAFSSILEAIKMRERQLAEVNAQLEHLDGLTRLAAVRPADILTREIRARITEWHGLVGQQTALARRILRKILVGRLTLTPKATPEARWYEFSGRASCSAGSGRRNRSNHSAEVRPVRSCSQTS